MDGSTPRNPYRLRMESVIDYINQNLGSPLNLQHLAQVSLFSPYHFHRIFTSFLGETPQDYINRLRLERAANLIIKSPERSITEIALTCGFSSSATFARSFKKHFGVAASSYIQASAVTDHNPVQIHTALNQTPQISVQNTPGYHVAYISSMKGYGLEQICLAWERLYLWMSAHGYMTGSSQAIGISFDDPLITPKEKCRYYACMTVPNEMNKSRIVSFLDIPPFRCAVCRITCDAEEIEIAYHYIFKYWFPDSGFAPADFPCFEIYHQTPDQNPLNKYIMDICIPLEPL